MEETSSKVSKKLNSFFKESRFNFDSSSFLSIASNLIFCFNKGDLIKHILLRATNKTSRSKCMESLIRFYSFKMFLIHFEILTKKSPHKAEKLKEAFLASHKFESLKEFLESSPEEVPEELETQKNEDLEDIQETKEIQEPKNAIEEETQSKIEKESESKIEEESETKIEEESETKMQEEMPKKTLTKLRKSVVLTHTKYSNLKFDAVEVLISDLEEKGSDHLKKILKEFLQNPGRPFNLLIHFNNKDTVKHFMYLRHQLDNWLSEFDNENLKVSEKKHVVFLVYKPEGKDSQDIDFLGDWNYQVIENLKNSYYRDNMEYLGQSSEDIFKNLRQKKGREIMCKMFFRHLETIPFKKHCSDVVKNQLIPIMSHSLSSKNKNNSDFSWELLGFLHEKLVSEIDFEGLKDWEEMLLDKGASGLVSVEDVIIGSGSEIYSRCLKNAVRLLKKDQAISHLFSLGWMHTDLKKQLAKILFKKLKSELKNLK